MGGGDGKNITICTNCMQIVMLSFPHRQCCSGKELVDWLMKQNECMQSRSQAVGMWQVLVDEGILVHGKNFIYALIMETFSHQPQKYVA